MRKRTVRRIYSTAINPLILAQIQCSKLSMAQWNAQLTPVLSAVHALSTGDWSPQENWQPMFEAPMRIESMLKLKHMPDHGFIGRAQGVYTTCLARMDRTGSKSFHSDELATIREVSEVYGDLLKEVTNADYRRACDHAYANVDRVMRDRRGVSANSRAVDKYLNGARV